MVAAANPLDLTDSKRIFLNHIDFLEFAKNVEACSLNGARPYAQAMALAVKNNLSRSICELELLEKSVATFSSLKFMNAKGQISAASTKVAKPAAAPAAPEVVDSPSKSSNKKIKTNRMESLLKFQEEEAMRHFQEKARMGEQCFTRHCDGKLSRCSISSSSESCCR
jgi:hypothetical protein